MVVLAGSAVERKGNGMTRIRLWHGLVFNLFLCGILLALGHAALSAPRVEKCIASVYKHGTRTASGERFNPRAKTAAHRKLPFGTTLRVVNMMTGKHTDVRVNDRGPFVRGRCVDLTPAAALAMGLGFSIAPVIVEVLE